ncbi:MAG: thermonuclease family protein [Nocardioides sp.]
MRGARAAGTAAALTAALTGGTAYFMAHSPSSRDAAEPVPGVAVRVSEVLDGDTLRVQTLTGEDLGRVRLLGIDAPEVAHGSEPADCYAQAATDHLLSLAPVSTTVTMTADPRQPDTDRYGRLLRYVDHQVDQQVDHQVDDVGLVDVAEELLEAGEAELYQGTPDLDRSGHYLGATRRAKHAQAGLWGDDCARG